MDDPDILSEVDLSDPATQQWAARYRLCAIQLKITTNCIPQAVKRRGRTLGGTEREPLSELVDGEHVFPHISSNASGDTRPERTRARAEAKRLESKRKSWRQMQYNCGTRDDGGRGSSWPLSQREDNGTKRRREHHTCGVPIARWPCRHLHGHRRSSRLGQRR